MIIEIKGYNANVQKLAIDAKKISAVSIYYKDINKTAIWIGNIAEEFISSDDYLTVLGKWSSALKEGE